MSSRAPATRLTTRSTASRTPVPEPGVDRVERCGRDLDQHLSRTRAGALDVLVTQHVDAAVVVETDPLSSWLPRARAGGLPARGFAPPARRAICFEFEPQGHCNSASNLKQFCGEREETMLVGETGARGLDAAELAAFFTLMEVSSTLQHAVEQQLRSAGDLSCVQFLILARLAESEDGQSRMTDLADLVVYSRSGLTYQASQMEKAGFITRSPSADDERSTIVTITDAGREQVATVLPGHVAVLRKLLLDPLSGGDLSAMTAILDRVRDAMREAPPRSAAPRAKKHARPIVDVPASAKGAGSPRGRAARI